MRVLSEQEIELTDDAAEASVIITSFGTPPAELRAAIDSPSVQWVQLPTAGIELYADSLRARPDLTWTSAKGAYALPVAEHALTLTLALLRELPTRVRATSWARATGTSLHGLRVVIVGAGGVALEILRLVKCFDTRATIVRRLPTPVAGADATLGLEEMASILPETDIVILAAALTPGTRNMFDAETLALLPEHAHIVNIGRGGLIDTEALTAALAAGRLAGAGLDVTAPEPLPDGHPLWSEPRALITPHAADTIEMIHPLFADRVAANLPRFANSEPLDGLVDPHAGY